MEDVHLVPGEVTSLTSSLSRQWPEPPRAQYRYDRLPTSPFPVIAMRFDPYGTTSVTPSGYKGWLLSLQHRQGSPECDVREVSLVSGGITARRRRVSIQVVALKDLEQSLDPRVDSSIARHCQPILFTRETWRSCPSACQFCIDRPRFRLDCACSRGNRNMTKCVHC